MPFEIIKNADLAAIEFSAKYAHQSELFDKFFISVLGRPSFKLLPLIAVFWFIWFNEKRKLEARTTTLMGFAATFLAIGVSRLIQNLSSERARPMHSEQITQYVAPYGVDTNILHDWSSFPSDHAAISFAISLSLFFYNKLIGVFCALFSLVVICAPRVYGGYHYLSDILGGILIGIACAVFITMLKKPVFSKLFTLSEFLETNYRQYFYVFTLILSYQLITMFNDIRWPLAALIDHLSH